MTRQLSFDEGIIFLQKQSVLTIGTYAGYEYAINFGFTPIIYIKLLIGF